MYKILIFGDSIAAGREVNKTKSWPSLLAQFLDKKERNSAIVYNLGISGDSSNDVIKRFPIEAGARCKKIYPNDRTRIVFAIGINDARCIDSKNNPVAGLKDFKNNISFLIENAGKFTNHVIFVGLTLVDESKTTPINNIYFFNDKIKIYNEIIKTKCKKKGLVFLNIVEEWSENYLSLLSKDGIHPNERGHQKIFKKIKPLFIV